MLARGSLASMILWGPPGCGKTTIARLLAEQADLHFEPLSAVFSGVADLQARLRGGRAAPARRGRARCCSSTRSIASTAPSRTASCPYVEDGTVTLVGATTENPSFELNGALLSRCQVLVLRRLDDAALELLLGARRGRAAAARCRSTPRRARRCARWPTATAAICSTWSSSCSRCRPTPAAGRRRRWPALLQRRAPLYDKDREEHYNLISALHKSLRGSDPDAALYWFARMLNGGEDPRYIARRLVRFAVEDIGLADPQALPQALAALGHLRAAGLARRASWRSRRR